MTVSIWFSLAAIFATSAACAIHKVCAAWSPMHPGRAFGAAARAPAERSALPRSKPRLSLILILAALVPACASIPALEYERAYSVAMPPDDASALGRALAPLIAAHPGKSGAYPLASGLDALAARVVLADLAQRSMDIQYYIFKADTTGNLVAGRLLQAADRGVRVRLLLDDINTEKSDRILATLDQHPNIEVRLFNPFWLRDGGRVREFLSRGRILNRRMHNKSFTVDGYATIVGGRNIGDEYFEARPDLDYGDLDVLAVGPVAREVSTSFDAFWNTEAAVPIAALTEAPGAGELDRLRRALASHMEAVAQSPYADAVRGGELARNLRQRALRFHWCDAQVLYDNPHKVETRPSAHETHLGPQLRQAIEAIDHEFMIISPYFIPGKEGVDLLASIRAQGPRVIVLTNSLASNDVLIVQAAYAKYRKALLEAGVELYELKAGARRERTSPRIGDSSRAALHAKAFIFDRRQVFIGSLNIDPRSLRLNTEIGILLDCPDMAAQMAEGLDTVLRTKAYRLELADRPGAEPYPEKQIVWHAPGEEKTFYTEPDASVWQRTLEGLLALLPVEGQL